MAASEFEHVRLDRLQVVLILVCLFDMGFFLYYLFSYELALQNTISDSLFTRPEYATVLTVTLTVRLLGAVLFLMRYRYEAWDWMVPGFVGVVLTLFGWLWLVLHKINIQHFTGVFIFCLGSGMYSISFLRMAGRTHKHLANVHLALEIFLFVSAVVLVIAFVAIWVVEETDGKHAIQHVGENGDSGGSARQAYIVEHAAYMAHLLFYMSFFLFHSPDPLKPPHVSGVYEGEAYAQDNGGVVMRPLLHAGVTVVHTVM